MKIIKEDRTNIIEFLRGLKYGDEYDFEPVGEWEVSAWVTNPSMDFPHGAYIVQVNNFDLGKEFYAGDIESQKELEYKIEKMIMKIQSLKEDKEINEKETQLKEDLSPEDVGVSSLFNDLIQKEYEQLTQYDSVQITLEDKGDDRFSDIFEYIKDDINIHIGMLQSCLEDLNGSGEQVEQGEQQADQVLGEDIEKSDKMSLDDSLFEDWYDEHAVYDYPDELIHKTYDFAQELDPYDFEDSFDEWVEKICEVHPDDIIGQTQEELDGLNAKEDSPELYQLGQEIISLAQEFKKSIGME